MNYKNPENSKVWIFMNLTCYYKAEMPNTINRTLDVFGA